MDWQPLEDSSASSAHSLRSSASSAHSLRSSASSAHSLRSLRFKILDPQRMRKLGERTSEPAKAGGVGVENRKSFAARLLSLAPASAKIFPPAKTYPAAKIFLPAKTYSSASSAHSLRSLRFKILDPQRMRKLGERTSEPAKAGGVGVENRKSFAARLLPQRYSPGEDVSRRKDIPPGEDVSLRVLCALSAVSAF